MNYYDQLLPNNLEILLLFSQDDNAPCHASLRTTTWKAENNLDCLDWPSQSPDINIIENVECVAYFKNQTEEIFRNN